MGRSWSIRGVNHSTFYSFLPPQTCRLACCCSSHVSVSILDDEVFGAVCGFFEDTFRYHHFWLFHSNTTILRYHDTTVILQQHSSSFSITCWNITFCTFLFVQNRGPPACSLFQASFASLNICGSTDGRAVFSSASLKNVPDAIPGKSNSESVPVFEVVSSRSRVVPSLHIFFEHGNCMHHAVQLVPKT